MRKLLLSFIGLVIIGLGNIFILKTGGCEIIKHKIPFELKGILYYREAGDGIFKYNFLEDKLEKTLLKGTIYNEFIFLSLPLEESPPYRTFRLRKYNLKGKIIEEWELPTTHPMWGSCNQALSPNQRLVARVRKINRGQFYRLVVSPLNRLYEEVITEDLGYSGIVWISNTDLLYIDINNELIQINISTKEKQKLGYKEISPDALSPDGKYVLCSKDSPFYELCAIYLLHVQDMKLTKLTRCGGTPRNFIWSPDGKYFIFSKYRHPLISLLQGLLEMEDVYVYSFEHKKAYRLIESTYLSGGFWLEE